MQKSILAFLCLTCHSVYALYKRGCTYAKHILWLITFKRPCSDSDVRHGPWVAVFRCILQCRVSDAKVAFCLHLGVVPACTVRTKSRSRVRHNRSFSPALVARTLMSASRTEPSDRPVERRRSVFFIFFLFKRITPCTRY